MKRNITVINWSGLNYGDIELFHLVNELYIKDKYEKIYLFADSGKPFNHMENVEFVDRVFGRKKNWLKAINRIHKSDKVFCGGGDIIRGEIGTTLLLFLAALMNKDIAICGVGVIEIKSSKSIVKNIKNKMQSYIFNKSKLISVRDEGSYKILKDKTNNKELYKDVDLCFLHDLYKEKSDKDSEKFIAISIIPPNDLYQCKWGDELYRNVAKVLDKLYVERGITPIFLPGTIDNELKELSVDIDGDDKIAKQVIGYMNHGDKAINIDYIPNLEKVSEVMDKCEMLIGFRLHYIITALINRKPIMAFKYASKIKGVLDSLGLGEYSNEVDELSEEYIYENIINVLDDKKKHEDKIDIGMGKINNELKDLDRRMKEFFK